MPANPSDTPNEAQPETPAEPMSRAERRAAARGKTVHHDETPWSQGKVAGARNNQSTRRSFSNRRSGG
jgi:hypothetical protein